MASIDKRSAQFTIGGTEYSVQVSKFEIHSGDSDGDFVTFAQAAAGGAKSYTLEFTCSQDAASGTLWDRVWSSPGATVAVVYKPYGNVSASVSQPWYNFACIIQEPDGVLLGGEADTSTSAVQTIDGVWSLLARPVKQTS